jgi:hypothetical protein
VRDRPDQADPLLFGGGRAGGAPITVFHQGGRPPLPTSAAGALIGRVRTRIRSVRESVVLAVFVRPAVLAPGAATD